ncbi:MAG TPA: hypothetical protein VFW58_10655 [Trichococcus sp.]|nr:hypothetical protein [Trichococcus sp.]
MINVASEKPEKNRSNDKELIELLGGVNDEAASLACLTERNGNCGLPIGGYAHRLDDGKWEILAFLAGSIDEHGVTRRYIGNDPLKLAETATDELLP